MSTRAAAKKVIDWSNLSVALKLKPETSASLSAFRKRHEELQRTVATLLEARSDIDFNHYRSILKNKKVVDDAEKALKAFAPAKYDVQAQLKVIDSFEAKALDRARKTADQVSTELKDLKDTLENIDKARPLDELTVDDVLRAKPDIDTQVEERAKSGDWHVPKYAEKFGDLRVV